MTRLSGSQWRYCVKVGIATALGYVLTQGDVNQYSIYSAFTAALVVGTSVGEDLATSANRVKGTLAGMIAGTVVSAVVGPNFLTIGAAAALTALIALAFGWGITVARIGITICIITLAVYSANAVDYELLRALNTLIGIVAGLAVTFFVWPVRSRNVIEHAAADVLSASRALLDAMARDERELRPLAGKLHDRIAAVVKAGRDAQRERRTGDPATIDEMRVMEVIRLGADVLSAALTQPQSGDIKVLQERVSRLAGASRA